MNDSHISRWVEEHGTLYHDKQTLPLVLPLIKQGDVVIDGGAFIGDTTAPFLDRVCVGSGGSVLAFEPNPDARECLRRNCPAATIYAAALGNTAEDWMKLERSPNAGANFLVTSEDDKENVPICRIDALDLRQCDFIKLDIEGMELEALKGAEQTINRFRPKMLIEVNRGALERQGTRVGKLTTWLALHGYEWEIVQPDTTPDADQYDILCKCVGDSPQSQIANRKSTISPWHSPLESLNEIRSLAGQLKKFCSTPAYTHKVRQELSHAGVIPPQKKKRKKRK